MSYGTVIQSGSFTSTGVNVTLPIRSDVDWMRVINETRFAAGAVNNTGVEYIWRRGMTAGTGIAYQYTGAGALVSGGLAAGTGFTLYDSSASMLGAAIAVAAGTNATSPVYTTATTAPVAVGSIVRVYGTNQTNLNGLDFTVGAVTPATNFTMEAVLQQAPGVTAGANGFWQFVAPNLTAYKLFYPGRRVVANITQANPAVVTTLVDHGYVTGQQIRFQVPSVCGMNQISGLTATVTVTAVNTFTVNIDTTGFAAFAFPLPASVPFTPAEVVPVGETPSTAGLLDDATYNQGLIGMTLAGGAILTPAGVSPDVISWVAGKSENL
jgi:hypothetical protein